MVAPTIAFARDRLARLRSIPGVQHAALSSIIPLGGRRGANGFDVDGRQAAPGQTLIADQRHVSPGYFTTMNIALVEGRAFQATDDARGEPVVIINRTMAKRFWPQENPIDRRWLTGIGALIAVGGALAGGRFIAGLLFDTRATDPTTLAGVVAATMVLALAAGIVPTRRAMSVEPIDALRAD